MTKPIVTPIAIAAAIAACFAGGPAAAADKAPVVLAKCQKSLGTVAVVDGDTQGWTKYGLGSPRDLIAAMATESGCFQVLSGTGGTADFLMNAIAGDKEEVDKGVEMAKTAVIQGAVRSGAINALAGNVPVLGGMMGMFGGIGGKKKTISAGLRIIDPRTGQILVAGSGVSTKSVVTFGGAGEAAASATGYGSSKDGQQLTAAFVQAFNGVVNQAAALQTVRASSPAPATQPVVAAPAYATAVETRMYGASARSAPILRSLRAATALTPTGRREGLFVEVRDSFGTQGWVSVEDLK